MRTEGGDVERIAAQRREAPVEDEEAAATQAARVLVSERSIEQQADERDSARAQAERARPKVRLCLSPQVRCQNALGVAAAVRAVRGGRLKEQWHQPDAERVENL